LRAPSAPEAIFEQQPSSQQAIQNEDNRRPARSDDLLTVPDGADPSVKDRDLDAIKRVGYGPLRLVHFGPFSRVYFVRHKKNPNFECMVKVEAPDEIK
jgi:hypothetical protein